MDARLRLQQHLQKPFTVVFAAPPAAVGTAAEDHHTVDRGQPSGIDSGSSLHRFDVERQVGAGLPQDSGQLAVEFGDLFTTPVDPAVAVMLHQFRMAQLETVGIVGFYRQPDPGFPLEFADGEIVVPPVQRMEVVQRRIRPLHIAQ